MKAIEELEMSLGLEFWRKSGNEVDSVFTGLPEEYIANKSASFFSCTDMPTTLHEPSLSNMQKLKSLKIVAFQADEVKLTDVTVYYGFLKMRSLKHLTLDVFPISKTQSSH
ncbi:hypothetical protein Ocin01_06879 [Orchesella cincta]|uniref:Uncharacterized protein n=1 Tax=Orchesella cincta TaxID=48709 RepID=A0A1D2N3G4_ORCCI|nr:hypothetical protein Ocin01_06879 [Orchesella cincta]